MDKLTLKFMQEQRKNGDFCTNHADQCANITKEIACGFAEWLKKEGYTTTVTILSGTFWKSEHHGNIKDRKFISRPMLKISQLFDLYLKSL